MKAKTALVFLSLAIALSSLSGTTFAGRVPWDDPDGNLDDFTFSDGGSDNGLFGTPVVSGNRFIFHPVAFKAHDNNCKDGVSDSAADRLFLKKTPKPGKAIHGLAIEEFGDYHIVGGGEVSLAGALFVTNLIDYDVKSALLGSDPPSPISDVGQGLWTASASVNLLGEAPEWTKVTLALDNFLVANATGFGANAKIQKKVASQAVIVRVLVPEPSTLLLLSMGAVGLLVCALRKRR